MDPSCLRSNPHSRQGALHGLKTKEVRTCARAHSLTLTMRSCSGWNTCPTLPMGCGSVTEVGKWPL